VKNKVNSFLKLPRLYKIWFVCCYFFSGLVRAAILLLPFRYLSPYLGAHYNNIQLTVLVTEEQKLLAWHIGRMTELACQYTPWESKCLVQAFLTRCLLRYYRIPCVLFLGVMNCKMENDLKAHAWLSVGSWVVSGRKGHKSFTVVSTFVSPVSVIQV